MHEPLYCIPKNTFHAVGALASAVSPSRAPGSTLLIMLYILVRAIDDLIRYSCCRTGMRKCSLRSPSSTPSVVPTGEPGSLHVACAGAAHGSVHGGYAIAKATSQSVCSATMAWSASSELRSAPCR